MRKTDKKSLILAIHVDDCAVAGVTDEVLTFKDKFGERFPIKDLGPIKKLLGMKVEQNVNKSISISQKIYVKDIIKLLGLEDTNSTKIPIAAGDISALGTNTDDNEPANVSEYLQIIGKILYASTATRPDFAYVAAYLGRFSSKPTKGHMRIAKKVGRYLVERPNVTLIYPHGQRKLLLETFADADWAGDKNTRKSTSGMVLLINGVPSAWGSNLQSSVALSSAEAEYMSLGNAVKEIVWQRQLFGELRYPQRQPSVIYEDN